MSKGYIYVLSNESMPGILKIGKSIHGGKKRASELYSTGVATPFCLEFEMLVDNVTEYERLVHESLSRFRVNDSREFFNVELWEAKIEIIELLADQHDHKVVHLDFCADDVYLRKILYDFIDQGIRLNPPDIFGALDCLTEGDITSLLIRHFTKLQSKQARVSQ